MRGYEQRCQPQTHERAITKARARARAQKHREAKCAYARVPVCACVCLCVCVRARACVPVCLSSCSPDLVAPPPPSPTRGSTRPRPESCILSTASSGGLAPAGRAHPFAPGPPAISPRRPDRSRDFCGVGRGAAGGGSRGGARRAGAAGFRRPVGGARAVAGSDSEAHNRPCTVTVCNSGH